MIVFAKCCFAVSHGKTNTARSTGNPWQQPPICSRSPSGTIPALFSLSTELWIWLFFTAFVCQGNWFEGQIGETGLCTVCYSVKLHMEWSMMMIHQLASINDHHSIVHYLSYFVSAFWIKFVKLSSFASSSMSCFDCLWSSRSKCCFRCSMSSFFGFESESVSLCCSNLTNLDSPSGALFRQHN